MEYTNLSDLLKGICDAIRAKKGTAGAIKHQDIPSEIASIKTQSQDVLSLASGITSYTESFTIDGEERPNVLVQPSDFSDASKVTLGDEHNSYLTYNIQNIVGAENEVAAVIAPGNTTTNSYKHVFWFDVDAPDSSETKSKTYLIALRAKASIAPTSYFPQMAITYYASGTTSGGRFLYFTYKPTTEWNIFYVIANIPENNYLKDITMCFTNQRITHYIDWITAYDITGTSFANMTFGARATAYSADVLSGKSFYKDGVYYTGNMTNNGTVTPTLGRTTTSYTIPAGKHSGSGKVSLNIDSTYNYATPQKDTKTYYPGGTSPTDQVFTSFRVAGDSNLVASNIKNGVSIFGVNGNYGGSGDNTFGGIGSPINATAEDRTSISFRDLSDVDNIIGFYIVAIDTVNSSNSYDYITSLFINNSTYIVQSVISDATVEYYTSTNGSRINWNIVGAEINNGSITYSLSINITHDYPSFRRSISYACYPIYKKGMPDVDVEIEIT